MVLPPSLPTNSATYRGLYTGKSFIAGLGPVIHKPIRAGGHAAATEQTP